MPFNSRATLPATAFTLPARVLHRPVRCSSARRTFSIAGCGLAWAVSKKSRPAARTSPARSPATASSSCGPRTAVRAFYNVCRHRGTQLCAETPAGSQARFSVRTTRGRTTIEGRLIGAPHMDGSPGFPEDEFPLGTGRAPACGTASCSCRSPLPVPRSRSPRGSAGQVRALADGRARPRASHRLRRQANWKLIVQNYNECLHCPTLHPSLNKLSHYLSGDNEPLQPTYMGGRMDLCDGVETMSMDGTARGIRCPDSTPPIGGASTTTRCSRTSCSRRTLTTC